MYSCIRPPFKAITLKFIEKNPQNILINVRTGGCRGKRGNFESSDILFGQLMLKVQPVSKFFCFVINVHHTTHTGLNKASKDA